MRSGKKVGWRPLQRRSNQQPNEEKLRWPLTRNEGSKAVMRIQNRKTSGEELGPRGGGDSSRSVKGPVLAKCCIKTPALPMKGCWGGGGTFTTHKAILPPTDFHPRHLRTWYSSKSFASETHIACGLEGAKSAIEGTCYLNMGLRQRLQVCTSSRLA